MNAIRPVFLKRPTEPSYDLEMGANQDEYTTLPVTAISRGAGGYFVSVSRWNLTDEERQIIADGGHIVHQVIHSPGAYPPMNLQVVVQDEDAVVVE